MTKIQAETRICALVAIISSASCFLSFPLQVLMSWVKNQTAIPLTQVTDRLPVSATAPSLALVASRLSRSFAAPLPLRSRPRSRARSPPHMATPAPVCRFRSPPIVVVLTTTTTTTTPWLATSPLTGDLPTPGIRLTAERRTIHAGECQQRHPWLATARVFDRTSPSLA